MSFPFDDGQVGFLSSVSELPCAPRALLWLATLNAREREEIRNKPALASILRETESTHWTAVLRQWREEQASHITHRWMPCCDDPGMRRQALHDLQETAAAYAALQDGRCNGLFSMACRLSRYVAHDVLTYTELSAALIDAASANGALGKHGLRWACDTIRRAIVTGRNDALPPLARAFRSEGAR